MYNLVQIARDVKNIFTHARPLSRPTHIIPDNAIKAYYEWKNKKPLPDRHVFPFISMLQGHYEAFPAWEEFITTKLTTLFDFKPTSYEPALSTAIINTYKVYLVRQADDFYFASTDLQTINKIITTLQSNGVRIRMVDQSTFNRAEITEYQDTIKIHATSYTNILESKIGYHL